MLGVVKFWSLVSEKTLHVAVTLGWAPREACCSLSTLAAGTMLCRGDQEQQLLGRELPWEIR